MIRQVILVAGGPVDLWPDRIQSPFAREETCWIGIDKGAWHLLEHNYPLDIAIGDFDSLTEEELIKIRTVAKEVYASPVEKEDTDTELALEHAVTHFPFANYWLIGISGGRFDHTLSNFWLPLQDRFRSFAEQIRLWDQFNDIYFFTPGRYELQRKSQYPVVSFAPLTEVKQLTLEHVKYPLTDVSVAYPRIWTSNELVEAVGFVSFTSGLLAVIYSNDQRTHLKA